jgi:MoaA/NifB/PqqE/SkfB family radical SAM enzyme
MPKIELTNDPIFNNLVLPEARVECESRNEASMLCIEITNRCAGSCAFCFASSTDIKDSNTLPATLIMETIDAAKAIGIKEILFTGGDPLYHPQWFDLTTYALKKDMTVGIDINVMISKNIAKKLCQLEQSGLNLLITHLDTLNQSIYNQVHTNPKTMEQKIKGLYYLLEAGFPQEKMMSVITLSKPIIETIEETIDWLIDEMGMKYICICSLKGIGFGNDLRYLEPSLSDYRRAHEYHAKKLGEHWLRIGSTDFGKYFCRTYFQVHADGTVSPCNPLRETFVGNIYDESLETIYKKHKDHLLCNYKIKGYCGSECENRNICFGCRANAYYYLGDIQESDPKCWLNPSAPEYCYIEAVSQ